ncbi:arylamine N-acetyltransferase [Hyalangium versicolor]|uniref:arylamine N-acetyltransferase n=1 Tax=Hyalangium versicolor TaxID=2861190 RepID=UPI001CCCC170|nr:arylamine N-acetyltransferase [Hyalangium versicolor]
MNLPRLDNATVDAYLARLHLSAISVDLNGLACLQRAHLRALPFHNLSLLASEGNAPELPPIEASVEGNIAGVGGGPLQLTPPFVSLLQALGFESWLAAARMGEPGDHCVGIVQLPEGRFLVDVGSGLPLLEPLPLQGGPLTFTHQGQSFRFEQDEPERYRLLRLLPGGRVATVYRVDPAPRAYATFERLLRTQLDRSGERLTRVHAVRMTEWALAVLQDGQYRRFGGGLTSTRPVTDWQPMAELLRITFGLPENLIEKARGALLRGGLNARQEARPLQQRLRFLLSLAVTGRAESASALLHSLDTLLERSSRPRDSMGLLLLDNSGPQPDGSSLDAVLAQARRMGIRAVRVSSHDTLDRLTPFQRLSLLPSELSIPVPIGASRTLQTALLHEHLRTGCLDLPHPGDGGAPVVIWMLDDDLTFQRLCEMPEGLRTTHGEDLFARAEQLWSEHPEVSVALGTFTGEPPIPGYATLQVQLHDLAGNLSAMVELPPDAPWRPGTAPRELRDYYYDHAQGSAEHLHAVFPWWPPSPVPWKGREAFRSLCAAFSQVPHGHQVTRPLTYRPLETLAPSRARGGNALFLDLDALVAAPYPVMRGADGIMTRRADTLWAHLFARDPLLHLVQADLDLLHGRQPGDGSSPLAESKVDLPSLRRFVEGQERGVVLARLLERGGSLEPLDAEQQIAVRRGLLARSQSGVRLELAAARSLLSRPEAWWWHEPEDAASARNCLASLEQVEELVGALSALEAPALPEQLSRFGRHVAETLPAWRAAWA